MVWEKVKPVEPECGELGENVALPGNGGRKDAVEGRDAVRGDQQEVFVQIVDVADFAGGHLGDAGKFRCVEEHGRKG